MTPLSPEWSLHPGFEPARVSSPPRAGQIPSRRRTWITRNPTTEPILIAMRSMLAYASAGTVSAHASTVARIVSSS